MDNCKTKGLLNNRRIQAWTVLNFAISFMFCIFAPTDAYYANMDEYWFSLTQMLSVCVVVFALVFMALEIIALLASNTKASDYAFLIFLILFIFFYIQGNFIPRHYGVLNGTNIDWNAYPGYAAASIVLGIVCVLIAAILCLKFREHLDTIGKLISTFVFLIQLVTICTLIIQNGLGTKTGNLVVTQKIWIDIC